VRDPSALACLWKTKRKACLGKTLWEAVTPHRKARGSPRETLSQKKSEGGLALLGRTVTHDYQL
jgi:hypothetical protein